MPGKRRTVARSAIAGRFVKKSTANAHLRKTVVETIIYRAGGGRRREHVPKHRFCTEPDARAAGWRRPKRYGRFAASYGSRSVGCPAAFRGRRLPSYRVCAQTNAAWSPKMLFRSVWYSGVSSVTSGASTSRINTCFVPPDRGSRNALLAA